MLIVPEDDGDKILVVEDDGVDEHESVTEDLVAEDGCMLPNFPHFPKSLVCSAFLSCWSDSGDG